MKKHVIFLVVLFSLVGTNISLGQIVINEILSSNTTLNLDEDGTRQDWVELYNNGSTDVNLSGYGLSDDPLLPYKWIFPVVTLPSKQYLLIWASGKNRAVAGSPLHTNFKLSPLGNTISLTNATGTKIDNVPAVPMTDNVSYGRLPNGTGSFVYFDICTPDAANSSTGYSQFLNPPTFSVNSGFFTQGFNLTLTGAPGTTILYTLDGSEPDQNNLGGTTYSYKNQYPENPGQATGPLLQNSFKTLTYTAAIPISDRSALPNKIASISSTYNFTPSYIPANPIFKGTVVRAKVIKSGALSSPTASKSYFISPQGSSRFSLPVVSLSTNENNLFDYNNGIYVAGVDFDNWRNANPSANAHGLETVANYDRSNNLNEKVGNITYIVNGTEVINQDIGLQIHGLSSKDFQNKSLNILARSTYGSDVLKYAFFKDRPFTDYSGFVLRNSGNDFNQTMFRDALCHKLMNSLNVLTQAYQPTVTFINGEYWGILNLRERINTDYINLIYNVPKKEIDFLQNDGVINYGDDVNYRALQTYLNNNSLSVQANYDYVVTQIDPDSFEDYFISNIFFANEDWPGTNIYYWRKKTTGFVQNAPYGHDGRWRWVAHDMDATFASMSDNVNANSLAAATDPNGPAVPNPAWSTLMLRRMLENNTFKIHFINRFADLLNTYYTTNRILSTFNNMKTVITPEMPDDTARWKAPVDLNDWSYFLTQEENFANARPGFQRQHIMQKFGISSTIQATLDVSDATQGYITMNTIDILPKTPGVAANPYPWLGIYFNGIPVTVKAVASPGYAFVNWTDGSNKIVGTSAVMTITPTADFNLKANFSKSSVNDTPEVVYFWLMDGTVANNVPLTSINSTYHVGTNVGVLNYQSCLVGYPFVPTDLTHYRKADMERRNSPTSLNYVPQANGNLDFALSGMKGIQVTQPFQSGGLENNMIFSFSTAGFKNIKFDLAVMDEGAATGITLEYATNSGTPVWITTGMSASSFPIIKAYQLIEADFTNIAAANNNSNFKIRLRFTGPNMTVASNGEVTFNNVSVQGVPMTILGINENYTSNFDIYPNPVRDILKISSQYDLIDYKIFAVDGKMIQKGKMDSVELNVSNLPSGVYLLQLNADGISEIKKFIKN